MIKKYHRTNGAFIVYQREITPHRYQTHEFSYQEFASEFGVSVRTVQRWLASEPPIWLEQYLAMKYGGLIPQTGWERFYHKNGRLYAPAGREFKPSHLEVIEWHYQRLKFNDEAIKTLEHELQLAKAAVSYWREAAGESPAANDELI